MNLDRLRLFLKIVDTGSVSAAGREAHLTQPAVSRSLKQLEDEVGAELFDRDGRRFTLTAAGRALVASARHLVKDAERAKILVQRAATATYFDIRVGAVDSLGVHVLPSALRALADAHPELRIKIWMARTQELLDRVDRGTLDLAFVAYSGPPSERATRVGTYGLKYFARRDRFPELETLRTELELQRLPIVEMQALPGQPSVIRPDADAFAVVQNLSAVKALVLSGLGVGQLLEFMLTAEERAQLVTATELAHDPECGVYCVRAQRDASEVEEQMIEALSRAVAQRLGR
jgi:DNA-binding transcriptional LysR family regulator